MENTSKRTLKRRDRGYYRQRQRNRVFATIVELFAEEAEKGLITKKVLAEMLDKDPSQITRWLSVPSNLELDTISDILLAMGAEMDYRVVRLAERPKANYVHPLIAPYMGSRADVGQKADVRTDVTSKAVPIPSHRNTVTTNATARDVADFREIMIHERATA
jgi:hypothetical protein